MCHCSHQDFALAAKSVRTRMSQGRIFQFDRVSDGSFCGMNFVSKSFRDNLDIWVEWTGQKKAAKEECLITFDFVVIYLCRVYRDYQVVNIVKRKLA